MFGYAGAYQKRWQARRRMSCGKNPTEEKRLSLEKGHCAVALEEKTSAPRSTALTQTYHPRCRGSCFKNRTVYRRVGRRAGPSCPCPLRGDVTCICPRTAAQDADDRNGERRAQSETQAKRALLQRLTDDIRSWGHYHHR